MDSNSRRSHAKRSGTHRLDFRPHIRGPRQARAALRSQIATLKTGRGQHRKFLPYAFTEHGALMAASVLNSPRAIEVSIFLVRTFVAMREAATSARSEIAARLDELERSLERRLAKHDQAIADIFAAIRALMQEPDPKRRPIGFVRPKDG